MAKAPDREFALAVLEQFLYGGVCFIGLTLVPVKATMILKQEYILNNIRK